MENKNKEEKENENVEINPPKEKVEAPSIEALISEIEKLRAENEKFKEEVKAVLKYHSEVLNYFGKVLEKNQVPKLQAPDSTNLPPTPPQNPPSWLEALISATPTLIQTFRKPSELEQQLVNAAIQNFIESAAARKEELEITRAMNKMFMNLLIKRIGKEMFPTEMAEIDKEKKLHKIKTSLDKLLKEES